MGLTPVHVAQARSRFIEGLTTPRRSDLAEVQVAIPRSPKPKVHVRTAQYSPR
jgi:hypothetical protein